MTKKKPPTEFRPARFIVCDENGGHEATRKEIMIFRIAFKWAVAGNPLPPEALKHAARAYDELQAAKQDKAHALDLAA